MHVCIMHCESYMSFIEQEIKSGRVCLYVFGNVSLPYMNILNDSSPPDAGEGVRFSLRGITYQNNSLVTLEDIGEWDYALLCVTDQPVCCRPPYTGEIRSFLGNWFFPNETTLPSSWPQWDLYRDRGQMLVNMHRRRGGVSGIYHCVIPDSMNLTRTVYIGVYTANTGEW